MNTRLRRRFSSVRSAKRFGCLNKMFIISINQEMMRLTAASCIVQLLIGRSRQLRCPSSSPLPAVPPFKPPTPHHHHDSLSPVHESSPAARRPAVTFCHGLTCGQTLSGADRQGRCRCHSACHQPLPSPWPRPAVSPQVRVRVVQWSAERRHFSLFSIFIPLSAL